MKTWLLSAVSVVLFVISFLLPIAFADDTELSVAQNPDDLQVFSADTVTSQSCMMVAAEAKDGITLTAPDISCTELNSSYEHTYITDYQWYTCSDENGGNPEKIVDATGKTLTVFPDYGIQYFSCRAVLHCDSVSISMKEDKVCRTNYTVGVSPLPTVYINTANGASIASRKDWERATISIAGCDTEAYNLDTTPIKIKGRGNSTWMGAGEKNSYSITFDTKQDLFAIGKDRKWALLANYYDKSLLRNWLASRLDRAVYDYGDFDVVQIPVDLVLNGKYVGNYYVCSTIKLGRNRVNVPDISDGPERDVNGDGIIYLYDTGFLIEIDDRKDAGYYYQSNYTGACYCLADPNLDDDSANNAVIFAHIQNVINRAESVLYSGGFDDSETGYAQYIDVDSVVDYLLIQSIAKNVDFSLSLSIHFYYDPADGLLHMAPVWDFDIAFGNINYNDGDKIEGYIHNVNGWFHRLLQDPAFVLRLSERWNETKESVRNIINYEIPAQADLIRISAEMNFACWDELGKYIWPSPNGYESRTTYQSEVDYLINWTSKRIEWLDGYIADQIAW